MIDTPRMIIVSFCPFCPFRSDAAAVSCLVELGASVNLLNGDMQNPLHAACYKGSVLCATILIDRAEQLNIPVSSMITESLIALDSA